MASPSSTGGSSELGLKRCNLQLSDLIGDLVLPGDEFVLSSEDGVVVLGPGLQLKPLKEHPAAEKRVAVANKAGLLVQKKPNTFYIEMAARTVSPKLGKRKKGSQYNLL
jgi:hypothetical protein